MSWPPPAEAGSLRVWSPLFSTPVFRLAVTFSPSTERFSSFPAGTFHMSLSQTQGPASVCGIIKALAGINSVATSQVRMKQYAFLFFKTSQLPHHQDPTSWPHFSIASTSHHTLRPLFSSNSSLLLSNFLSQILVNSLCREVWFCLYLLDLDLGTSWPKPRAVNQCVFPKTAHSLKVLCQMLPCPYTVTQSPGLTPCPFSPAHYNLPSLGRLLALE